MKKQHIIFLCALIATLILFCQCEPRQEIMREQGLKLEFSVDTLYFDTVFTTIGTTTKYFKIYNPYDKPVEVTSVSLAGGSESNFRLNINGEGDYVNDLFIGAKDSVFIFVEATINPNNDNNPLVIQDSVVFDFNGNEQDIDLVAWGQDVHLFRDESWNIFIESQTWSADKPYLIYGNLIVERDEVLEIDPGVKVFLHRQASIVVLGSLKINGTVDEPVVFRGDRLEEDYEDLPGQWGAIACLPGSKNNEIENTKILNATAGFQFGVWNNDTIVDAYLKNVEIGNSAFAGIVAYGAKIDAYNTLIYNSEYHALDILRGGEYQFFHSTFTNLNRKGLSRQTEPLVLLANNVIGYEQDDFGAEPVEKSFYNDLDVYFGNSIIYGYRDSELIFSDSEESSFKYKFENCILKTNPDTLPTDNTEHFKQVIFNENPEFKDYEADDFELDTLSPAKDAAEKEIVLDYLENLEYDLKGQNRLEDQFPDIGVFERIENDE